VAREVDDLTSEVFLASFATLRPFRALSPTSDRGLRHRSSPLARTSAAIVFDGRRARRSTRRRCPAAPTRPVRRRRRRGAFPRMGNDRVIRWCAQLAPDQRDVVPSCGSRLSEPSTRSRSRREEPRRRQTLQRRGFEAIRRLVERRGRTPMSSFGDDGDEMPGSDPFDDDAIDALLAVLPRARRRRSLVVHRRAPDGSGSGSTLLLVLRRQSPKAASPLPAQVAQWRKLRMKIKDSWPARHRGQGRLGVGVAAAATTGAGAAGGSRAGSTCGVEGGRRRDAVLAARFRRQRLARRKLSRPAIPRQRRRPR